MSHGRKKCFRKAKLVSVILVGDIPAEDGNIANLFFNSVGQPFSCWPPGAPRGWGSIGGCDRG